jgi:hypothetical protein
MTNRKKQLLFPLGEGGKGDWKKIVILSDSEESKKDVCKKRCFTSFSMTIISFISRRGAKM